MSRRITGISVLAIGIALGVFAGIARAGTITLTDQNSAVTITPSSSAGLSSWTVGGTPNIAIKQWFWASAGTSSLASLDTLSAATTSSFSDGSGTEGLVASYSGSNGLSAKVIYLLTGSSGTATSTESDLQETILLTNTTTASQTYNFYQYSHFNLSGNSTDSIQHTNANTYTETGDSFILQSSFTPVPTAWEGAAFPATLTKLQSGTAALTDSPAVGGSVGPGNVTWTNEWSPTIAAGATVMISEDQLLNGFNTTVPEPSTIGILLAAGATAVAARFRLRRARAC